MPERKWKGREKERETVKDREGREGSEKGKKKMHEKEEERRKG